MAEQQGAKTNSEVSDARGSSGIAREGLVVRSILYSVDRVGRWSSILCGFYSPNAYTLARTAGPELVLNWVSRVDAVLMMWWAIVSASYVVAYYHVPYLWFVCVLAIALRITNIVSYNLRVALVETDRTSRGSPVQIIISTKRSAVLGLTNFVELIVCFGGLYAAWADFVRLPNGEIQNITTFLYFSCITQMTIGYGDISPLSGLRLVAALQGLAGLLLITLTVSRFISLIRVEEYNTKRRDS